MNNTFKITPQEALTTLQTSGQEFKELFNHGSLSVEIYQPHKVDNQKPHDRDELYVVVAGTGKFYNDGITVNFTPGTFLFVPAGKEHYFFDFTTDFSTWVFFYGPVGGEQNPL